MIKKRKYTLSQQETSYYCMPAVIQAILRRHGREESQDNIATEIKCDPKEGSGFGKLLHTFLAKRKFSLQAYCYNEVLFKEPEILVAGALERKLDLFVACPTRPERGHITLAVAYRAPTLYVLDPKDSDVASVDLEKLYEKMWEHKFGGFGIIGKL